MFSTASSLSWISACLLLLCLGDVSVPVSAQKYFRQVVERTQMWAPRENAALHWINRTTTFRDGLRDGKQLLYGGDSQAGPSNDVWASSDAMTWVWVAGIYQIEEHPYYASTVFDPVYDAGTCQDASFRQYLAGGRQNGQITSEVWMTVDGFRWTNQGEAAWDPVYKPSMTGDSAGTIYLAGGILDLNANPRRSSGAVWMSSSQGRSWRQVSTGYDPRTGMMTGPGERAVSILLSMPSNALLYMTGVNTGVGTGDRPESYQKDVWVSTNQGRAFDPINLNAPFGRRDDASAVVTVGGIVAMVGGYGGTGDGLQRQGQIYNDVWATLNGGYTWGLCVANAEWEDRRYQMTALDGDGYLWVMGGLTANGYLADMWKSTWSFNSTADVSARCRVTVPACGVGLQCGYGNRTLVVADGSAVYCDACPYTCPKSAAADAE